MKALFIFCIVPVLAACGQSQAAKPVVMIKYIPAQVEPECLSDDPAWTNRDVTKEETRSQTAWREHKNKTSFESVLADRATCRAGLQASQSKPKRKKQNG